MLRKRFALSLVSRDKINHDLRVRLDKVTDKWGVKVNRVELQEVNPPTDIRHAMENRCVQNVIAAH